MAYQTRKYDDAEYHLDATIEAGQPPEHAFAHIGVLLGWLIRRDLHDPGWFPPEVIDAVKSGAMNGADLESACDGVLASDMLSPTGADFLDKRYDDYAAAWERLFEAWPPYGAGDDEVTRAAVEPVIDALYDAWRSGGSAPRVSPLAPDVRPRPAPVAPPVAVPIPAGRSPIALIPPDLTDPPLDLQLLTAAEWGDSLLRRALLRLNVRATDASLAVGQGGLGDHTLVVTVYAVPGVAAERLHDEFATVIFKPGRKPWQGREVGGRTVRWADATASAPFNVAWWARDGLVFHLAGDADDVERAIARFD